MSGGASGLLVRVAPKPEGLGWGQGRRARCGFGARGRQAGDSLSHPGPGTQAWEPWFPSRTLPTVYVFRKAEANCPILSPLTFPFLCTLSHVNLTIAFGENGPSFHNESEGL